MPRVSSLNTPLGFSRRVSGATIVCAFGFVLLAACLYALSWNPLSAGFLSDDAIYVLMADAFCPFKAADPILTHYVLRQSLFPPFYPLMLGVLGAGSDSLLWAHLITTTTLVLSMAVYGFWIFLETKDRIVAAGLVLIFAVLPGTLMHSLELLSEFPYLLLSLLALWLAARSSTSRRGFALIALCVGLAALTRTAGLSLLLAIAIWLFRHRVNGRLKYLALAAAPSAIWFVYKKLAIGSAGGYDQFWLWLVGQVREHGLVEFVPQFLFGQIAAFWKGLLTNLDMRPSVLSQITLGIVLLAALPVWLNRLRSWQLDAWYLLIGGAMIVLYPFPNFFTRLLLPWMPIVLLYSYMGVGWVSTRWGTIGGKPILAYGTLAALLLTLLPSLGFIAQRLAEPVDPELANWKHTRYWFRLQSMDKIKADVSFRQSLILATKDVSQWVDRDECVFGVYTAIGMLYGQRIFEQPPPPSDDNAQFDSRSRACPYFFLVSAPGTIGNDQVPAFYPSARLPTDRIEVVHVWTDPRDHSTPTATLLRLKPPA